MVEGAPEGAPFERIHVMGVDRDEIYFEVRRSEGETILGRYRAMVDGLPELYPDVAFGALGPRTVAGHAAQESTFRWSDQVRHLILVEVAGSVYEVIFRPLSAANWAILDSVTIED